MTNALTKVKENEGVENYTSKDLAELLKSLTITQIRYCIARQHIDAVGEAAEAIGLKPNTAYHWGPHVEYVVKLMATDGVVTALHLQNRIVGEAMAVKIAGLKSKSEAIRQACATELIDRGLGKAIQRLDARVSAATFTIQAPDKAK